MHYDEGRDFTTHAGVSSGGSQIEGLPSPGWMLSVPELRPNEIEDRLAWAAAPYPDQVVQKIAKAGRFDSSALVPLRTFLITNARWHLDHQSLRHPDASFAAERQELVMLALDAQRVLDGISGLSDVSTRALWHPFHHIIPFLLHPDAPSGHLEEFCLNVNRRPQPDGSVVVEHLRPKGIVEGIQVLRALANAAAAQLPIRKGGQRKDFLLERWVWSSRFFWHRWSTKAFDPRSNAFDFCYLALKQLEPGIGEARVRGAIRAVNKDFQKNKC